MALPLAVVSEPSHLPALLVIGLAVFFGTVGAGLFQKLRIPQVVGYIVIGVIVGRSGLGVLDAESVGRLAPFSFFALGVIGFMVGGELRVEIFRKYGKSFLAILLSEGLGAFVCVSALVTVFTLAVTADLALSTALGILLGAVASATAPAATVDVLWEYKTRGILTTTVFAIVALDDGLALLLYGLASSMTDVILGGGKGAGFWAAMGRAGYELGGAVAMGSLAGLLLNFVLRVVRDREKALPFLIGSLAVVIGLARALDVDLILATMTLGVTLANLAPRRSKRAFDLVASVASPIYVLFFVLVGARLHLGGMAPWMWGAATVYVVGRTAGKMLGATLGARWGGAPAAVRKYLGLCLFSQAGVAVGLAILASDRFAGHQAAGMDMGLAIIGIVTATTFLVQIIGPPCVKLAVKRAGEIGLNVTEDDLIATHTVGDLMDRSVPTLRSDMPLRTILRTIAQSDATAYPVTDPDGKLLGIITFQGLRQSFAEERLSDMLLAYDLMSPPVDTATEDQPLADALAKMRDKDLECLPVVAGTEEPTYVGMLETRKVRRRLAEEILRRQQKAEAV